MSIAGFPFLNFCCSLISFSLFSKISHAADTITPAQTIGDGQSLVSSGQSFELGFFSPDGNSRNRYLGIWFKNISPQTIVWVANRYDPLTDSSSGILRISNDGNLVLLNQTEGVIWSSSNSSIPAKNPVAQLLETGNLVIRDESGGNSETSYLWQSFDYPTDTQLAGMKLGWNIRTGMKWFLTSWKSEENPSIGEFTYSIDVGGLPQLVFRKGTTKLFRTGPLNSGLQFSGTLVHPNSAFIPIFSSNAEELYYTFETDNNASLSRLTLSSSGQVQRFRWDDERHEWAVMFTVPKDDCDKYGQCGANSICKINDLSICECLNGFTPKSPKEWALLNWNHGCVRKSPLDCGKGEGFVKIKGVKSPDLLQFWVNSSMSLKDCEVKCLNDCSCVAYANSDFSNKGHGCLLWFGNLIDIRQLNEEGAQQDLYIRVPPSELERSSSSNRKQVVVTVVVVLSVVVTMLLSGGIILFIMWSKKRGNKNNNHDKENKLESGNEDLELPLFDLTAIEVATDNFSNANKIGEGGFGPVYKGKFLTGQEIAVKRLSKNSGQGLKEFKNEAILIAKLQHRNLVRLLGCCIEEEEMMLVYEYMPNKSLNSFIFDQTKDTSLNWEKRFNIIVGIARGLLYLHRDSRLRIIHRDLKASNILLDNEMNPKISDFGIARTFRGDQIEDKTRRVVGTYGYMPPEYAVNGLFSMKSDVFSFGVLVLEMVSGKRNRGFYHPNHDLSLLGHAWNLWNAGKDMDLIDTLMEADSYQVHEVSRCIQVGLLCVQLRREDRPTMSLVLSMLDNEGMMVPQPKQPGFYTEKCPIEIDSSSSNKKPCSPNELTVTLTEGR